MSKPEPYKNINSFSLIPTFRIQNRNEHDKVRSKTAENKRKEAEKWNHDYLMWERFFSKEYGDIDEHEAEYKKVEERINAFTSFF